MSKGYEGSGQQAGRGSSTQWHFVCDNRNREVSALNTSGLQSDAAESASGCPPCTNQTPALASPSPAPPAAPGSAGGAV
jgi:hypothetical protein